MKRHTNIVYGLLVLVFLVAAVISGFHIINRHDSAASQHYAERERVRWVQDSLAAADEARRVQREQWAKEKEERRRKHEEWERQKRERLLQRLAEDTITVVLSPFDPNTVDSAALVRLGLKPRQARSFCRYRQAGARFRKAEDVRRLDFITDSLYASWLPYITIAVHDTLAFRPLKKDTVLPVNTSDTSALQMIPGVGRYTAGMIVKYRERLGGYHSLDQLREIPRLRNIDSVMRYLTLDTVPLRPLYLNRSSVSTLARHPYMGFERAKAVDTHRHRHGPITSEDQLLRLTDKGVPLFTDTDLIRLRPYLSFDE